MSQKHTAESFLKALSQYYSPADLMSAAIKSDLANAITVYRMEHNLSQSQLAKIVEKTQSTVAKWETGDQNFTIDTLCEIAVRLKLDLAVKLQEPAASKSAAPVKYRSIKVVAADFSQFRGYRAPAGGRVLQSVGEDLKEM